VVLAEALVTCFLGLDGGWVHFSRLFAITYLAPDSAAELKKPTAGVEWTISIKARRSDDVRGSLCGSSRFVTSSTCACDRSVPSCHQLHRENIHVCPLKPSYMVHHGVKFIQHENMIRGNILWYGVTKEGIPKPASVSREHHYHNATTLLLSFPLSR